MSSPITRASKLMLMGLLPFSFFMQSSHTLLAQTAEKKASTQSISVDKRFEKELQAIAKKSAVKKALKTVEELEPQTIKDHVLLTEIPAPPFKEQARGKQYAAMLKAAGADSVWTDEVGNVIAKRRGRTGAKTVVLDAHLDTVFPEGTVVTVKQRGDTLFAPGIMDDTRGLAVVLTILRALEKNNIETESDVLFIGTVGEEGLGDLRGVKYLFRENGPKIDSYIAVDGGGLERITYIGLGSLRYRVTFKGPGGHSWGAFGTANPHHALGRAIHYFNTEADAFTKEGIRTSYNVGIVGGGTSVNSIPFESWMEVDMRSESPNRLEGIAQILKASVQKALQEENQLKRRGPSLDVAVDLIGERPSGATDPTSPLVQRSLAATSYFNVKPSLITGSTNSNIPISKGVPAVTVGVGGVGGGAHSLDEWWINDKGHLSIQRTLLLLLSEADIAR
ncbi:acetylornithine deacetylase/succinyl-diaminopimelate desuccinylase-like protein [Pontibacter aydingkolensis]|nr:M20/M25/M40 family metallo-hydrolase [Pontibacter aydingkolensis]